MFRKLKTIKLKSVFSIFLVSILATFLLGFFNQASATHGPRSGNLYFDEFQSDIKILPSGDIEFKNSIKAFFDGDNWHGIEWKIPTSYPNNSRGIDYTIGISIHSITDADGNTYKYTTSDDTENGALVVRVYIPEADHSEKNLLIDYTASNVIQFYSDHDEFYWNLVEPNRTIEMSNIGARIDLPEGTTGVKVVAASGVLDGDKTDLPVAINGDTINIDYPGEDLLPTDQGITLNVSFDKGFVAQPLWQTLGLIFMPYSWIILIIPGLYGIYFFKVWGKFQREKSDKPIVVSYVPPKDLPAALAGTLIDSKIDSRDILAILFELSARGFIQIRQLKSNNKDSHNSFEFELLKGPEDWANDSLESFQLIFLTALFGNTLTAGTVTKSRELGPLISKKLVTLQDRINKQLFESGYCKSKDSMKLRTKGYNNMPSFIGWTIFTLANAAFSGFIAILGCFLFILPAYGFAFSFSLILIITLHLKFSQGPTLEGYEILRQLKGFEEFLVRVEKDRIDRSILTIENFATFLPYALALGISPRWIQAFEEVLAVPPSWFISDGFVRFGPNCFDDLIRDVSVNMDSSFTSFLSTSSSSSGAGFSSGAGSRMKIGGGFSGGSYGGF